MKVLVTGGAGQVGRALRETAPPGVEVLAPPRSELDLADMAGLRAFVMSVRPAIVINAAAHTAVDRAEAEEAAAHAVNATAVGLLAAALAQCGGRLVHLSTDFVFDGTSSRAYRPDDARNPQSAYGRTKAAGEDAAGPEALVVRTSWVYASGGANFVRTMLRLMREKERIGVVADQIGAPTWATGLARTVWPLALGGATGTFHHSDAGVASWYDFAMAIREEALALGMLQRDAAAVDPIATRDYPTPARRPAFSLLDCSATRAALADGHTHWRENLRRMLLEERALG